MFLAKDMQVVVLIGGLGTRLEELAEGSAKAMADVHGKPFFYYQLELMKWYGLSRFVFCIGYGGQGLRNFFGDGSAFGVHIRYSDEGQKLLGTGGALRKALPLLEEEFVLIYGDSYMDIDYSELIYRYGMSERYRPTEIMVTVYKNKGRYDRSNIIFKDGRLAAYDKKDPRPGMEYIDYGVSVVKRKIVEGLPDGKEIDLADVYRKKAKEGKAAGHEVRTRFYEIGTPQSLDEFRDFIYQRRFVKKRAVILDRDGTLNETVFNHETKEDDSPLKPEELKLLPHTADALKILRSLGYALIVITNQPAAAKGKTTLGNLYAVNNRLRDLIAEEGIYLDDILMCPHHPFGSAYSEEDFLIKDCDCRKPRSELFEKAIEKFNIDIGSSYAVGDRDADIEAGRAIGARAVFLTGRGQGACGGVGAARADHTFEGLYEFAEYMTKAKGEADRWERSKA